MRPVIALLILGSIVTSASAAGSFDKALLKDAGDGRLDIGKPPQWSTSPRRIRRNADDGGDPRKLV